MMCYCIISILKTGKTLHLEVSHNDTERGNMYVFAISGVLSGILIKKLGLLRVSLLGSLLAAAGFTLSFLANYIYILDVLIGLVSGRVS